MRMETSEAYWVWNLPLFFKTDAIECYGYKNVTPTMLQVYLHVSPFPMCNTSFLLHILQKLSPKFLPLLILIESVTILLEVIIKSAHFYYVAIKCI